MMNKKGMTLVEILGAMVIFGIIISLLATLIFSFLTAQNRISLSSMANTESTLVKTIIENDIDDLNPTTYDTCPADKCIILQKEYEYIYDEVSGDVVLDVLVTPETYQLEITDNVLYINGIAYDFNGLVLTDGSEIVFSEVDQILYITIVFYLTDGSDNVFDYVFTYSYELSVIPT